MVSVIEGIVWGLLVVAAVGYARIAIRVKRHQEFPGRSSFLTTCLLLSSFLGAATVLFALSRLDVLAPLQAVFLVLTFATALTLPLAWVRFALQYTGQRFPIGRYTFLRLGVPVLVTLVAVASTMVLGLLRFEFGLTLVSERTFAAIDVILNYSVALTGFYLAALLVVGTSIIAWTSYSFRHLSDRGGVLLGFGVVVTWIGVVLPEVAGLFTGQPMLSKIHAAVGAIVGVGAVWSAVHRYDLFGAVPAAGNVGRDVTVEEMNDPVLVTDRAGRVIDLNEAAEDAFRASVDSLGRSVDALFDSTLGFEDLLAISAEGGEVTRDHRTYESTASELRDEAGRLLGHSFVFHDVTQRKRREQRIQVLNRVLRHNLRNDLNVVDGYAKVLEEQPSNPERYIEEIQETASDLISIGEKAREIEQLVGEQQAARTASLSEVVNQAVEEARETVDDCTIHVDVVDEDLEVDELILTSVLGELVENACRHSDAADPHVRIETAFDGDRSDGLTIRVIDNGPGIPDHELVPLREGTETALEHGSGLGLWLVEWGVEKLDGRIDFEANEPRGTVATVSLNPVE